LPVVKSTVTFDAVAARPVGDTELEARLASFAAAVAAADLQPLWTQTRQLMPPSPAPATRPHLWRWERLRALAEEAGELITIERGGERRVLALANPGLGGAPFASSTLWGAVQYLGPRETAPAHRHTPVAIRFVLEGEGVWTTVDGDACHMHPGDLVLTPGWTFHDHENGGDAPMLWFDGLDMPLVIALDAVFYENHDELCQPVDAHDRSRRVHGAAGLRPLGVAGTISGRAAAAHAGSPLLVYPWTQTDAALDALITESESGAVTLEYIDPATGGPALPTLGSEIHRLRAGAVTATVRKVGSSVYVVHRGRGTSVIDGIRFGWGRGDMFVVPSWAALEHEATTDADLFSITDRPALVALGLYRERIHGERQRVVGEFDG
jgi:gentisate 1,2-dioxygenase